ncbi:MAG: gliding motility-associated ABC transporter substrate-binding protein GldG [Bacteroidetes bacterium]|nr:gliding motility-associated ABC transporter substrate-binding protein GldG [Bacteroidota bacterium]
MVNRKIALLTLANVLVLLVVLNQLSSIWFFRIDLTEEKRFTVKPQTKELLGRLNDDVLIEVFLEGDLNPGFKRFQKQIRELLDEFRIHSDGKLNYLITDPTSAKSEKARNEFMSGLISKGVQPINIIENKDGQRSEKIVFPGALLTTGGNEWPINLLRNSSAQGWQAALNQSMESMEFEFVLVLQRLIEEDRKTIGWITGHGEADGPKVTSGKALLAESFDLLTINAEDLLKSRPVDLAMVVQPTMPWSDRDLFALDQYVMRGGKVLFFVDQIKVDMSRASDPDYFAEIPAHGLNNLLFRYGIRLNSDAVQDAVALPFPVVTGSVGGRSQITPIEWPFYPLASVMADHPATRNLDAAWFRFASTTDTVKAEGIQKTPLIWSSPYTRTIGAPVKVSVRDLQADQNRSDFNQGRKPLAWLLEGRFTSLYRNQFTPENLVPIEKIEEGVPTKIVLISDGDFFQNDVDARNGTPPPVGFDPNTRQTFSNGDLVMNLARWLTDENGVILARSKKIEVRPLDKNKIRAERKFWQALNLTLPILIMGCFGLIWHWIRRKKYTSFNQGSNG